MLVNIRGYVFEIKSASGSQTVFQKRMYEQRSDEELYQYHREYLRDTVPEALRASLTDDLKGT